MSAKTNGHSGKTLLEQLADHIKVDADTLDYEFISTLPIQCCDMTSNPRFVHEALSDPRNADIVESTVKELKGKPWVEVYARCVARFAKRVVPLISGRTLVQTSPQHAFDFDYILADARRFAAAYNAEGITNDRFCIKLATTTAGVQAAKILREEGIRTLGTCLFNIPQALAAQQAGMYAISMYYNDPAAHADASLWPDVADPATQHPMSARHYQIRKLYDRLVKEQGKTVPQIKTASFVSLHEIMAMVELGADNVTLTKPLLQDMIAGQGLPVHRTGNWKKTIKEQIDHKEFKWEPWTAKLPDDTLKRMDEMSKSDPAGKILSKDYKAADPTLDYTADGVLDKYNQDDEVARVRLPFGLERFAKSERESIQLIQELQAKLA